MQDVRVLSISGPRRNHLTREFSSSFIDQFNPSGLRLRLTTRSVIDDVAAGYAGTIGYHLGRDVEKRDHLLEFSYWGLNRWTAAREVTGTRQVYRGPELDENGDPVVDEDGNTVFEDKFEGGSLFSTFDTSVGGFNRADIHGVSYEAEVHNWELSLRLRPRDPKGVLVLRNNRWRRECKRSDHSEVFFGFRVFSLDEYFSFRSRGTVIDADTLVATAVGGDYFSVTHNDLFGLHIGLQHVVRRCKWTWGLGIKAAPVINFADYSIRAINSAPGDEFATTPIDFQRSAEGEEVALIGELGIFASYKLRPNLAVRASYDLIWVVGLARAPEQLVFTANPTTRLNDNGHIFTQGLTLGTEWLF
jgi:hypothetical protein